MTLSVDHIITRELLPFGSERLLVIANDASTVPMMPYGKVALAVMPFRSQ